MQVIAIHRKIQKSAMHPKCPQNVKEAVQRIAERLATQNLAKYDHRA